MSVYEAEIGLDGLVSRVIVSPSSGWAAATLGGDWQETSDPYAPSAVVAYAGVGFGFDKAIPEAFIGDHWDNTKATVPDLETGDYFYATEGMLTWHGGKGWRNLLPDGNPNVWEPGVANWREYPLTPGGVPIWVQPTGAIDAYSAGFVVAHNGDEWVSDLADNVWEPGVTGWSIVVSEES